MKFILSLSLKVKIIIIACTVAAAAAVGAVIIINSEDAYRVIKVFELNGSAVVTRENTGDIDAYAGMNLESGDTLSVEENSTLRISLDSDKYILLDGGTVLKLIAQGTAADSRTVIELQTGTILNEIKNSLSANSSYEVNTPKATMAVRGTTFTVTTIKNPDGSYVTDLHTAEGTVSVQLFDENGEPKGAEIYVSKGGAVTILTDVNDKTGNPAAVDGDPHFVFRTDDGGLADCGDSDPVYYIDDRASAEKQTEQTEKTEQTEQTEQTVTAVTSDTVITETGEEHSETAVTSVTTAKAVTEQYDGTDSEPVSLAAMTAAEKREDHSATNIPKQPSETEPITTTAPGISDEPAATTAPVSSADLKITSVRAVTTAPPSMPEPIRIAPIVTTVPAAVTEPTETTVPTTESEPTETETTETTVPTTEPEPTETETTETTVPTTEPEPTETETTETTVPTTEPEPTETETTETTVPTTEPEPTKTETTETTVPTTEPEPTETETTETTVPTTEPEPTETETTETTVPTTEPEPTESETTETTEETTPLPSVYKVSFVDENGNVLSESEFDENETLGTLPQITDKKGYTAKWVSGGTEVTSDTVISADMEITAEYTPKPVTVHIYAPIDNDPFSTYGSVLTFTTLYDSSLSDNPDGYNIENLTEYVDGLYADYYENYGRTYVLKFISINGGLDPIIVTDGYIISGDYIYENSDGTLYAQIYFNYGDINDP